MFYSKATKFETAKNIAAYFLIKLQKFAITEKGVDRNSVLYVIVDYWFPLTVSSQQCPGTEGSDRSVCSTDWVSQHWTGNDQTLKIINVLENLFYSDFVQ